MRKIIQTASALVAMMMFSGCAGATLGTEVIPNKTDKQGMTYMVTKDGGDFLIVPNHKTSKQYRNWRTSKELVGLSHAQRKTKVLKAQFHAVAETVKGMGYKYFVITNINVSNLNGFPISDFNQLIKYVTLKDRKGSFATNGSARDYRTLIGNTEIFLRFRPVSNKIATSGALSVWKVSDFIK